MQNSIILIVIQTRLQKLAAWSTIIALAKAGATGERDHTALSLMGYDFLEAV